MLFVFVLKWDLYKKAFSCVKINVNSNFAVNLAEMLKYVLFCTFLYVLLKPDVLVLNGDWRKLEVITFDLKLPLGLFMLLILLEKK